MSSSGSSCPTARRQQPRPKNRIALGSLLGLLLAGLSIISCAGGSSPEKKEAAPLPPITNLRESADALVSRTTELEHAPDWINHERETDEYLYGIGVAPAQRDRAQDLFSSMQNGRQVIIEWLETRGPPGGSPMGLVDPLRQDPNHIQFEKLAYDRVGRRWYSLAYLSKAGEAQLANHEIDEINTRLASSKGVLVASAAAKADRVRAALRILFDVDRRNQWNARYAYFGGTKRVAPEGLRNAELEKRALAVLTNHGVRVTIETDGPNIPGLQQAVASALGQVFIQSSEFGEGLIDIRLHESQSDSRGMRYLVLNGSVQMSIEGGDALSASSPLRAVSTLDDLKVARARNARTIGEEMARIVREAIRDLAN